MRRQSRQGGGGRSTGGPLPWLPSSRDPEADRVVELVAGASGIPVEAILERTRPARVALARQVAMYLIHVTLQRSIIEAARVLGRRRQTASYACARIEDRREDPDFDAAISQLEHMVAARPVESRHAAG